MYNVDIGLIMANLKDYITIKEAAELLGVTPMTLRRWDKGNKLKPYRQPFSSYRLYKKSELNKFLHKLSNSKT